MLTYEYSRFFTYSLSAVIVVVIMLILAFFLSPSDVYNDKLSPYECGFHPLEDARKKFSVHFYLVALLFVAFDLEVLILVPWVIGVRFLDSWSYWMVMLFLIIVVAGFVYEWKSGALDW